MLRRNVYNEKFSIAFDQYNKLDLSFELYCFHTDNVGKAGLQLDAGFRVVIGNMVLLTVCDGSFHNVGTCGAKPGSLRDEQGFSAMCTYTGERAQHDALSREHSLGLVQGITNKLASSQANDNPIVADAAVGNDSRGIRPCTPLVMVRSFQ